MGRGFDALFLYILIEYIYITLPPNRPESTPSSLRQRHKDFGLFVKGARSDGTFQYKIENIFIQMLEAIHPEDALIVLNMVAKKAPVKGLTKKIVEERFQISYLDSL